MLNTSLKCVAIALGFASLLLVPIAPALLALVVLLLALFLGLFGPGHLWRKRRYGWRVKRKLLRFWLWLLYGKAHEFRHQLW